jgi:uncharacterized protein YegL
MSEIQMPGAAGIKRRDLHFFWVLDRSASMTGDKIQSLNHAIRESVPAMREEAGKNPSVNLLVRVVTFGDSAEWQVSAPTPVDQFQYSDVHPDGATKMGAALGLVADGLTAIRGRAIPPVIVLVTDGQPTDNFDEGLARLMATGAGPMAIRIGIAIGDDAKHEPLKKFINNPEYPVLKADNAEMLTQYIKWASTVVTKTASETPGVQAAPPVLDPPKAQDLTEVW